MKAKDCKTFEDLQTFFKEREGNKDIGNVRKAFSSEKMAREEVIEATASADVKVDFSLHLRYWKDGAHSLCWSEGIRDPRLAGELSKAFMFIIEHMAEKEFNNNQKKEETSC